MYTSKIILILCLYVKVVINIRVWHFGHNVTENMALEEENGLINIPMPITRIPLNVPPCMSVNYVRLEVAGGVPNAKFFRHSNTLTVFYEVASFHVTAQAAPVVTCEPSLDTSNSHEDYDIEAIAY